LPSSGMLSAAGAAWKARNYRPSCKRTVSGSNPLTGSTHQPAKTDPANLTLGSAYSSKVQQ